MHRAQFTFYRTYPDGVDRVPLLSAEVTVPFGAALPAEYRLTANLPGQLIGTVAERSKLREFCEQFIAMDDRIIMETYRAADESHPWNARTADEAAALFPEEPLVNIDGTVPTGADAIDEVLF